MLKLVSSNTKNILKFRAKLKLRQKCVLKDCCNNLIFATDCYLLRKREIYECFECGTELF